MWADGVTGLRGRDMQLQRFGLRVHGRRELRCHVRHLSPMHDDVHERQPVQRRVSRQLHESVQRRGYVHDAVQRQLQLRLFEQQDVQRDDGQWGDHQLQRHAELHGRVRVVRGQLRGRACRPVQRHVRKRYRSSVLEQHLQVLVSRPTSSRNPQALHSYAVGVAHGAGKVALEEHVGGRPVARKLRAKRPSVEVIPRTYVGPQHPVGALEIA